MRYIFLMAALLLAVPATALATTERAGNVVDKFVQMDKNSDGKVSRDEFFAAYPQMHEAAFEAIDTSKDKFISPEEWKNFSQGHSRDMMSSGMGGMGGTMPPGGVKMDDSAEEVRELFEIVPRSK